MCTLELPFETWRRIIDLLRQQDRSYAHQHAHVVEAQLDQTPAGMTLGELSQRMMVSNGNVTGLAERLVAHGLLDRRHSPTDRRAQLVSLTPEGRRAFRAMARAHEEWIADMFADLAPGDVEALMRLLAKTKASARKAVVREEAP